MSQVDLRAHLLLSRLDLAGIERKTLP